MVQGNLIINLGNNSSINDGDEIKINADSKLFQMDGCIYSNGQKRLIEQFLIAPVRLPAIEDRYLPLIFLSAIPKKISLCREINLEINQLKYTGKRNANSIIWEMINSYPKADVTINNKIVAMLESLNLNKNQT